MRTAVVDAQDASPGDPLSIGEVLSVLAEEFPDITISKIRFLESQGLVQPERNASGYRQFGDTDIERLRWILRQQRDHYLPLKVIRRALERGVDVIDAGAGDQPTLWTAVADAAAREEVATQQEAVARDEAAEARRSAARSGVHPAKRVEGTGAVRSGAARGRPRHSSPADVVAALQEDPRPEGERDLGDRGAAEGVTGRAESSAGDDAAPDGDVVSGGQVASAGSAVTRGHDTEVRPGAWPEPGPPIRDGGGMRELSRAELLAETELSGDLLDQLIEYGLVEPSSVAGEQVFDQYDLAVGRLANQGAGLGISPRHLRMYKVAAVREAGFLEQIAMPLLKQRNPDARTRAVDTVGALAGMGAELHAVLLGRELGPNLRP